MSCPVCSCVRARVPCAVVCVRVSRVQLCACACLVCSCVRARVSCAVVCVTCLVCSCVRHVSRVQLCACTCPHLLKSSTNWTSFSADVHASDNICKRVEGVGEGERVNDGGWGWSEGKGVSEGERGKW